MISGPLWRLWAALLAVIVTGALLAPLAHYEPQRTDPANQFAPPDAVHWLGTDQFGRDVLSRMLWGGRSSLAAAVMATGIAVAAGLLVGGAAASLRGPVDWSLMRSTDVLLAFPGLLLALLFITPLGQGQWQAALAVGIALAPAYARLVRAAVLSEWSQPYVEAARAVGGGPLHIARWHILPNVAGQLLAFATVMFAWALLNVAALDFLGVTGSPSLPTWGRLMAEGRSYLNNAPWIAIAPGVMLTLSVVAVTGLADAWRRTLPQRF